MGGERALDRREQVDRAGEHQEDRHYEEKAMAQREAEQPLEGLNRMRTQ